MSWPDFVRKYVWSEEKTPYLVPVSKLSRSQARNELFVFSVLTAAFFFVTGLLALLAVDSPLAAAYCFMLCSSAIALGSTRHYLGAVICATAPPALLAYLLVAGFPATLHLADKLLIGAVVLLISVYVLRVVAIARAYPGLPHDRPGN